MNFITRLLKSKKAATSVEYALIATIISIAAILVMKNVGGGVNTSFSKAGSALSSATSSGGR